MMLTDKSNIKEVLLFPANKPLANTGVAATSAVGEGQEQPLRVQS
jgi:lysyl-tRNA synthetase class 2